MVIMAEACDECTQNCLLMHKKEKNPSPVATTFFKVMFGDDCSKILYLPHRFARSLKDIVGKTSELEDSSGERWTVKYSKVDGFLAFEEGWNKFSLDHGLKVGDFLVFHHIMESHFVVLMYGQSGCPEIRHFGFARHQLRETSKNRKLVAADHHSCQSSSQSERSVYGVNEHPETRSSVGTRRYHKEKKITKKTRQKHSLTATMSPDVNTTNTDHPMFVTSTQPGPSISEKETIQRSELLVSNTDLDNLIPDTPTKKQCSLVNSDTGNVEDECRKNNLNDLSIPEINSNKSVGGCENNIAVGGGGDETEIVESGKKVLETSSEELKKKLKESTVTPRAPTCSNSIKKRLRGANFPVTWAKVAKIEPSETDVSDSRLHDVGGPSDSTGIFRKPIATRIESVKKEITMNRGSNALTITPLLRCFVNGTKTACYNSVTDEGTPTVKPEPIDYDEAPPSGSTHTSFSAVMCSYQYLELPEWVKIKSKVILLRNAHDLWPLLYINKVGLKVLTQGWELFARERGIQPGDMCEFVLESEPKSGSACNVFAVHVTKK